MASSGNGIIGIIDGVALGSDRLLRPDSDSCPENAISADLIDDDVIGSERPRAWLEREINVQAAMAVLGDERWPRRQAALRLCRNILPKGRRPSSKGILIELHGTASVHLRSRPFADSDGDQCGSGASIEERSFGRFETNPPRSGSFAGGVHRAGYDRREYPSAAHRADGHPPLSAAARGVGAATPS